LKQLTVTITGTEKNEKITETVTETENN